MQNKITFTDQLNNELVKLSATRAKTFNTSKKKSIEMQHELFIGAISAIDFLNKDKENSCITPSIYVSVLRGELIQERAIIDTEIHSHAEAKYC